MVNKSIEAVNDLIWKCYVVPLDRFILTLALRSFEGNESQVSRSVALDYSENFDEELPVFRSLVCLTIINYSMQVCFYIIQMLLIRFGEFKSRVTDFVKVRRYPLEKSRFL